MTNNFFFFTIFFFGKLLIDKISGKHVRIILFIFWAHHIKGIWKTLSQVSFLFIFWRHPLFQGIVSFLFEKVFHYLESLLNAFPLSKASSLKYKLQNLTFFFSVELSYTWCPTWVKTKPSSTIHHTRCPYSASQTSPFAILSLAWHIALLHAIGTPDDAFTPHNNTHGVPWIEILQSYLKTN